MDIRYKLQVLVSFRGELDTKTIDSQELCAMKNVTNGLIVITSAALVLVSLFVGKGTEQAALQLVAFLLIVASLSLRAKSK
ncbi:hypothetical protein [Alginatibacterium sediminis]|uniref:hypothetical protein n=1 Tax=Alginatibacterium sediminis TaxID=2164068 RepID=UPI001314D05E|nr:hypothetical protein [Alginatibacterium sediminis]